MENITQWKTKVVNKGSLYILVPKNVKDYEGITEDDLLLVTVKKINNNENVVEDGNRVVPE